MSLPQPGGPAQRLLEGDATRGRVPKRRLPFGPQPLPRVSERPATFVRQSQERRRAGVLVPHGPKDGESHNDSLRILTSVPSGPFLSVSVVSLFS